MQRAEGADLSLDSPGLAQHLLHDIAAGRDVVLLVGPSRGKDALDHAASALEGQRDRVVRVSGAGDAGLTAEGLGLPGLLRQLGRYAEHPRTDPCDAPERDITVLTTAGASYDRIILLVDNADLFESGALRAIELACQTGGQNSGLLMVFAGLPRFLALLRVEEAPVLRGRLLRGVRYTEMAEPVSPVQAGEAMLETVVPRSRRIPARMIGVACAIALGLFGLMTVRAFVPRETEQPAETTIPPAATPGPALGSAPAADVSTASKPGGDSESTPAAPLFVPAPAPLAEPGSTPKVRLAKQQPNHPGHAVRTVTHAALTPRRVAEREPPGEYIGSFSPGVDGVRSFKYRP